MKQILLTLALVHFGFNSFAQSRFDAVDQQCQAPGMSVVDEANCYDRAVQSILQGRQLPDSINQYCHSEDGGACDDFNGYQQLECMNACAYHQLVSH